MGSSWKDESENKEGHFCHLHKVTPGTHVQQHRNSSQTKLDELWPVSGCSNTLVTGSPSYKPYSNTVSPLRQGLGFSQPKERGVRINLTCFSDIVSLLLLLGEAGRFKSVVLRNLHQDNKNIKVTANFHQKPCDHFWTKYIHTYILTTSNLIRETLSNY